MDMAPKNNPHFAGTVASTFDALGVTQTYFHDKLGGPSDSTLRKIMDCKDVGVSPRTLAGLDKAFGWEPGSAARVLAGGEPTLLEQPTQKDLDEELISRLRHPAFVAGIKEPTDELTQILEQLMTVGLNDGLRSSIRRLLEDQNIAHFPQLFEELTRDRKIQVYKLGSRLRAEQINEMNAALNEVRQPKDQDDVEDATQQATSAPVDEEEKTDDLLGDAKRDDSALSLDEVLPSGSEGVVDLEDLEALSKRPGVGRGGQ